VLPWLRDALPFVFAEDVLIAVGDLWQDASACSGPPDEPRRVIVWESAPILV
jgi:hypothetical protein